jgi:hypothetical protein
MKSVFKISGGAGKATQLIQQKPEEVKIHWHPYSLVPMAKKQPLMAEDRLTD